VEEAAAAIRDVYENYEKYIEKGPLMREWASKADYEYLHPYYHTLVAPQKVVLGDVNEVTEDSITTNSQALYEKYRSLCQ
jgi:hypothetical protein